MLFERGRHERISAPAWDAEAVRRTIRELAADVDENYDSDRFWPQHPTDNEARGVPQHALYMGAAGVCFALSRLEKQELWQSRLDLADVMRQVHARYKQAPDVGRDVPSLFLGEVGILLAMIECGAGDAEALDRLSRRISENRDHPADEQLWGAPGTMLAAWQVWQKTQQEQWRELYRDNVRALWARWFETEQGLWIWEQDLYGARRRYIGAAHGAVGNLFSLLRGAELLDPAQRETLYQRASELVHRTARIEAGRVNFPPEIGSEPSLVQWCHGAPGIILSLRPFPVGANAELEHLLTQAGELVWQAGPLTKGVSLCHGTGGNGYALLHLFERTGEPLWLERAQAFAMHCIRQIATRRDLYGQGHYSLFTGDLGALLFMADCLRGEGRFPVLDTELPAKNGA
jgi:lantibiotic modifying enzyme